jgi:hypothetical protein
VAATELIEHRWVFGPVAKAFRDDLDCSPVVALVVWPLGGEPELERRDRKLAIAGAADDDCRRVIFDGAGFSPRLDTWDVDDRSCRSVDLGTAYDEARAAGKNQVELGVATGPGTSLVMRLDELVFRLRREVRIDAEGTPSCRRIGW